MLISKYRKASEYGRTHEYSCKAFWFRFHIRLEHYLRMLLNSLIMLIIPLFLFTIDEGGEELALDQVKDFTALIIIVNLDNVLG